MDFTAGFFLGISTGAVCLAYCGPVLIPYLLAEGKSTKQNSFFTLYFLSGRLIAYLITGLLAGIFGAAFLSPSPEKTRIFGALTMVLAIVLIIYGFHRFNEICFGKVQKKFNSRFGKSWPLLIPMAGGIVTGLNICPPFLLAITQAANTGTIGNSILYFISFFMGTSLYFLPLPFVGVLRRQEALRIIGKFAAILTGIFYLYQGFLLIIKA